MDLRTLTQETPKSDETVKLIPREITLSLNYLAPTGERYSAALVSRVPNGDERMQIERRASILAGGVQWESLSEYARLRCAALALISVQVRNIPDWLNQWITEDDDLLFAVRGEVERHNVAWFRSALGESATDATASRVSCASSELASFDAERVRPSQTDAQ